MKTLDELAIECGADKATTHPVKGHGYTLHYALLFDAIRFKNLKVLEIGVGGGESIRMWLKYFVCSEIYGVDIVEKTNPWNTPGAKTHPMYQFFQGNQTDETMWKCWLASCGAPDVIVDDGGHCNTEIVTTFNCLWPSLKAGGFYAIEDLNAGFTPGSVFIKPGAPDHKTWLHSILDRMMTDPGDIQSAYFGHELLLLKKK